MLILLSYHCSHPDDSYFAALHILTWLVFICTYMNTPNKNPELPSVWYKSQEGKASKFSEEFFSPHFLILQTTLVFHPGEVVSLTENYRLHCDPAPAANHFNCPGTII